MSGYADPQVENFEGDSSVRAEATVDCPIPQLSLLQDCADEVLKIEIDNKDLEVDGILTVTEVLLGATEATILDVDSKVPAGEKITTTIEKIKLLKRMKLKLLTLQMAHTNSFTQFLLTTQNLLMLVSMP